MRKSGILMHISSLPSAFGIGKLGESAYMFADFLRDCGVQVWQILPLSPTGYGDSPYQSFSVHAGNPYFIDFIQLEKQGYLAPPDYESIVWGEDPRRVDYARVYNYCPAVLHTAYTRFRRKDQAYLAFCESEKDWLRDYALFMALKDAHEGKPWYEWEEPLAMRDPKALKKAGETYEDQIRFYCVLQYWFYSQWNALKSYCNKNGISIVGDIPIYVAYDSADVWANPELFLLDADRKPIDVAGCPPDVFSPTGQLWGNPLYDWEKHKETGFAWWIHRLRNATKLYDTVRIDHFRGFESYYAVPYGKKTAEIGEWRKGPGMALFQRIHEVMGDVPIIAEDLGFVTPEVRALLKETGFPGMKVMQFAFDEGAKSAYLPQNFETTHCVAYTGTHDNMTLRGWANYSPAKTIAFAKRYLHCRNASELPAEIIRLTWSSTAELAVAQMQDFLDAGPDDRMNTPATAGGNWQYRTQTNDFNPRLSNRIRLLNELYNRLPLQENLLPRTMRRRKIDPITAEKAEAVNQEYARKRGRRKRGN